MRARANGSPVWMNAKCTDPMPERETAPGRKKKRKAESIRMSTQAGKKMSRAIMYSKRMDELRVLCPSSVGF